jgi:hypothetical protein
MGLIVVAFGTAQAFFTGLWAACPASTARRRFRENLVSYGRWLVASLTFQFAAAQERIFAAVRRQALIGEILQGAVRLVADGHVRRLSSSSGNAIRLSWTDEAH